MSVRVEPAPPFLLKGGLRVSDRAPWPSPAHGVLGDDARAIFPDGLSASPSDPRPGSSSSLARSSSFAARPSACRRRRGRGPKKELQGPWPFLSLSFPPCSQPQLVVVAGRPVDLAPTLNLPPQRAGLATQAVEKSRAPPKGCS